MALLTTAPSVAELEAALTVMAYIVLRHGDTYTPIFERLEREVEDARKRNSPRDRAQRVLASMTMEVTDALEA